MSASSIPFNGTDGADESPRSVAMTCCCRICLSYNAQDKAGSPPITTGCGCCGSVHLLCLAQAAWKGEIQAKTGDSSDGNSNGGGSSSAAAIPFQHATTCPHCMQPYGQGTAIQLLDLIVQNAKGTLSPHHEMMTKAAFSKAMALRGAGRFNEAIVELTACVQSLRNGPQSVRMRLRALHEQIEFYLAETFEIYGKQTNQFLPGQKMYRLQAALRHYEDLIHLVERNIAYGFSQSGGFIGRMSCYDKTHEMTTLLAQMKHDSILHENNRIVGAEELSGEKEEAFIDAVTSAFEFGLILGDKTAIAKARNDAVRVLGPRHGLTADFLALIRVMSQRIRATVNAKKTLLHGREVKLLRYAKDSEKIVAEWKDGGEAKTVEISSENLVLKIGTHVMLEGLQSSEFKHLNGTYAVISGYGKGRRRYKVSLYHERQERFSVKREYVKVEFDAMRLVKHKNVPLSTSLSITDL